MYHLFYNLGIWFYGFAIRLSAPFNTKAKAALTGRKALFIDLRKLIKPNDEIIWVHAASLGEAEMAIPIIQNLKSRLPNHKVLMSFFSPSGYLHFKQNNLVDYTCYLPLDKQTHVNRFLDIVNPSIALFIKYEIWANFFKEIKKRKIPLVLAPAIFREDHFYFKPLHRNFFIPILKSIDKILVQDDNSLELLTRIGIDNSQLCGDTRFDRVKQNAELPYNNEILKNFSNKSTLIAGSTWPPDERILIEISKKKPDLKMILAPHDVSKDNIKRIVDSIKNKKVFCFSNPPANYESYDICIIDCIGLLSRIYRYGKIAYIGGGFGSGLHNSLEAVAYGLPVLFGPNHENFIEPKEMKQQGFGFQINNALEAFSVIEKILNNSKLEITLKGKAKDYINNGAGASEIVSETIGQIIKSA